MTTLLTATACGGDTSQSAQDPPPSRAAESSSAAPGVDPGSGTGTADDTATPQDGRAQNLCSEESGLSQGATSGKGADTTSPDVPELKDVQVTSHDTCDRVTFTFSGPAPGYFAGYEDPLRTPGLGDAVTMPGEVHLKLVLSGVPETASLRRHGNIRTTGTVRGIKDLGTFEGELALGVGLDTADGEPTGYQVTVEGNEVVLTVAHR
ncbi:AMIN-like domain-containing (lipo)protein [Streptomyces yaizuensis]|uniref:AMIN-like domain-containing protein n=1 Tax=Streptomyces yaizuensis TaxID=2989713 RepID=A0ABQ5P5Z5_9ACTN|nr:hypothetical protein [Streptomyces sp. YSPA8]GLF97990.1 hypothetical protein SYYSPA8_26855 [Streptomyces sp. YSPA8]